MYGILHLNLKSEYFNAIKGGKKPEEYRLATDFWKRRLEGRTYDEIHIKCGYPKRDDTDRIVIRKWKGVIKKVITHPHFGSEPVEVYAIDVTDL